MKLLEDRYRNFNWNVNELYLYEQEDYDELWLFNENFPIDELDEDDTILDDVVLILRLVVVYDFSEESEEDETLSW